MRAEKKQIVDDLSKQVGASPFVLITDYTKMTVTEFASLRKKLRGAHAECHVVKNSMLRHAAKEAGLGEFDSVLAGMAAVVIGSAKADVSATAKILKEFTKATEKGKVKLGVMGKQVLQPADVDVVAELPSLDVLRGQLVGLLQTPATRIAVVVGAPASQLARVIQAHADKEAAAQPAAA